MPKASPVVLALALAAAVAGCAPEYLPNTDVEDNEFNRKVVEFCEDYRHAVERKNVGLLLKLANEKYYEDGATIDTSDDLDLAGLKGYLETKFREVKSIRYEIRYRNVTLGRNNEVYVDYTYSASYQIPSAKGDVWRRTVADNRLSLVPSGETFRIIAGM
jgi:hypothetical protein